MAGITAEADADAEARDRSVRFFSKRATVKIFPFKFFGPGLAGLTTFEPKLGSSLRTMQLKPGFQT